MENKEPRTFRESHPVHPLVDFIHLVAEADAHLTVEEVEVQDLTVAAVEVVAVQDPAAEAVVLPDPAGTDRKRILFTIDEKAW